MAEAWRSGKPAREHRRIKPVSPNCPHPDGRFRRSFIERSIGRHRIVAETEIAGRKMPVLTFQQK
jgi:hypothetical protein